MIDYVEPYTPADATYYTTENTFIEGIAYPAFAYDSGMAIYNPTLLTESEVDLLSSFEGWADPAFAGRASIEGPFAGAQYRPLFYQLNQDPSLGEDWFQSVSELNPTVFDSVQPQSAAIIAGDLAVGFNAPLHIIPRTVAAAGDDVPLKLAAAEYAIATPVVSVLVKDAPHPAAAKLWLEWILTQEAQSTITTVAKLVGLRDGFVPPESEKWWVELLPEVRAADEALIAKDRDALPELFLDKFGGLQG
jgi:iron(III) transport system substrate-binding protein